MLFARSQHGRVNEAPGRKEAVSGCGARGRVARAGRRNFRGWAIGAVLTAAPWAIARAEPSASDVAIAEQLYQYGRKQMAEKQYRQACDSFAESLRLDSGTGTLLNLAACHEALRKLTSAWVEFRAAADAARRESRPDRVRFAQKHLEAIEPRLSYLTLDASPAAEHTSWLASLDGKALGGAAWRIPIPVDPGSHEVVVRSSDGRQWSSVDTIQEGEKHTVTVPAHLGEPAADSEPRGSDVAPRGDNVSSHRGRAAGPGAVAADPDSGRRQAAFIVGGAGVIALGTGAFFGLRAFSLWNDRTRDCPLEQCNDQGVRDSVRADHAANVANWAIGLGAVAVGTAAVILLWPRSTGPKATRPASMQLAVDLDATGRVAVKGAF